MLYKASTKYYLPHPTLPSSLDTPPLSCEGPEKIEILACRFPYCSSNRTYCQTLCYVILLGLLVKAPMAYGLVEGARGLHRKFTKRLAEALGSADESEGASAISDEPAADGSFESLNPYSQNLRS